MHSLVPMQNFQDSEVHDWSTSEVVIVFIFQCEANQQNSTENPHFTDLET